jgi:fructose-1,6-bisphosphatase/inositol monophosphatase family enzyme
MRCTGAFVVEGAFVLQQRFRGLVGLREKLYDVAPCVLMALELGADVRYADGSPFLLEELKTDVHITEPWLIFPADSGFFLNR